MAKIDFLQSAHVSTLLICVSDRKGDFQTISLNGLYWPSYHRLHHYRPNDRKNRLPLGVRWKKLDLPLKLSNGPNLRCTAGPT